MAQHTGHPPNDEVRRRWQDPDLILRQTVGLQPGMVFADIGCGSGFFALPASRIVGERGKVYAVDIDERAIAELRAAAEAEGLANVITTVGPAERVVPCVACADVVFFGINLHDFEDPALVLSNARATIKPGGRLVDLDWKKEEAEIGPPVAIRFDEEKASGLISAAGFRVDSVSEAGPYHYVLIAVPEEAALPG